jgi:hypothetical protein
MVGIRTSRRTVEVYVDVEVAIGCYPSRRAQLALGGYFSVPLCPLPCMLTHFSQDLRSSHRTLCTSTIALCGAERVGQYSPLLLTRGRRLVHIKYRVSLATCSDILLRLHKPEKGCLPRIDRIARLLRYNSASGVLVSPCCAAITVSLTYRCCGAAILANLLEYGRRNPRTALYI